MKIGTLAKLPRNIYGLPRGSWQISLEHASLLALGTIVYVQQPYRDVRPYAVARWGKRRLRRLKYMPFLDKLPGGSEEYLPIREGRGLKFYVTN